MHEVTSNWGMKIIAQENFIHTNLISIPLVYSINKLAVKYQSEGIILLH
jgi:hypothetical protein